MSAPESVEADLGWALFAVVRGYRRMSDELFGSVPGGPRGYQVLASAGSGEPASQLALAHHLGVDRTVMTYLLDDLEQAGLVERRPDPADRRARRVVLTDAGTAALCGAHARLRAAEEELLGPLEPEERAALRSMLHRLATSSDTTQSVTCGEVERLTDEPAQVRRRRR